MPRRRAALACVTCQKPRRPQLMRIAVLLGLVARQRHRPWFGSPGVMTGSCPAVADPRSPPAAHSPAPAPRSAEPFDGEPQLFAPPHRTKDSRDRPAASAPAIPGSPARFATAKEPSIFQSLRSSLPRRKVSGRMPEYSRFRKTRPETRMNPPAWRCAPAKPPDYDLSVSPKRQFGSETRPVAEWVWI